MLTDDHVLVREGIRSLLESDSTISVVGEANNGKECLEQIDQLLPDILILDLVMPVMDGYEVLERLRNRGSLVRILILTARSETDRLLRAIDLGAKGYLVKDSKSEDLFTAIRVLMKNGEYIQPSLVPALNSKLLSRDMDRDKIALLTKRELEVLILVANGMFNKEIATTLHISERTVKNHISNIFRKIEVSDRTQAAVFAIKNDLIKLY